MKRTADKIVLVRQKINPMNGINIVIEQKRWRSDEEVNTICPSTPHFMRYVDSSFRIRDSSITWKKTQSDQVTQTFIIRIYAPAVSMSSAAIKVYVFLV